MTPLTQTTIIDPTTAPALKTPDTQLAHNHDDKKTLSALDMNPEVAEWFRISMLGTLEEMLRANLAQQGEAMSGLLASQYDLHLCPEAATLWLTTQLMDGMRGMQADFAQEMRDAGDSKANIARAAGVKQQNIMNRFPNLR